MKKGLNNDPSNCSTGIVGNIWNQKHHEKSWNNCKHLESAGNHWKSLYANHMTMTIHENLFSMPPKERSAGQRDPWDAGFVEVSSAAQADAADAAVAYEHHQWSNVQNKQNIWKHGGQTGCGRRARAKCTISDSKSSSNRCLDTFETFKQSAWHPVWKQLVAKSGPSCYNAILHKFFHLERLETLLILWHRSDCGGSPSLINDKGSTNLRSCPRPLLCQASVNEEWNCAMFAPPKKLSHTKTASYYHLAHCKVKLL